MQGWGRLFYAGKGFWRMVKINDETGTVHVVPAEDPSAAIPGGMEKSCQYHSFGFSKQGKCEKKSATD